MSGATEDSRLPRQEGEDAESYVRRLAIWLGYVLPDAPLPAKPMPQVRTPCPDTADRPAPGTGVLPYVPTAEDLDWLGPEGRDPGEEG